MTEFKDPRRF